MAQKSILEQALLQVQTLEEAVKANAKGILQSTMKEELNSLLKEQEDKDPDEEEKDVTGAPEDTETSDNEPTADDTELPTGDEELPAVDDEAETEEPEMELPVEDEDSEDVLDMTGASEEEVLKVFKAMKPEDGIVVKKEGDKVEFADGENEYIIKLDGEAGEEEVPEIPGEEEDELPGEEEDELPDELAEQTEPTDNEEIVYEIELDEEDEETKECEAKEEVGLSDGKPFDKKAKKVETKESVTVQKSHTPKDGQPFDKSSPQTGVKKLEAKEEALPGTANPQIKEPGKGQVKTSDGRPGTGVKDMDTPKKYDDLGGGKATTSTRPTPVKGLGKPVTKEPKEQVESGEAECTECGKQTEVKEGPRTKANKHGLRAEEPRTGLPSKHVHQAGAETIHTAAELREQVDTLKKQNGEYKKALVLFKDKLNEVATFNANLAYATRLFTEHSTTKQEKLDILKRFDTVSTITESKNLYATIKGELENKKPMTETAAEKISSTKSSSATEMLSESKAYENPQFKRMKDLMRKIQ